MAAASFAAMRVLMNEAFVTNTGSETSFAADAEVGAGRSAEAFFETSFSVRVRALGTSSAGARAWVASRACGTTSVVVGCTRAMAFVLAAAVASLRTSGVEFLAIDEDFVVAVTGAFVADTIAT